MNITPIFVSDETNEGLHSIHYLGEPLCEFERLLENWTDIEYVVDYCNNNHQYLKADYFNGITLDQVIDRIQNEAESLYDYLDGFTEDNFATKAGALQTIFKPLVSQSIALPTLQPSKFRYDNRRQYPDPVLRLYALRVGPNTFILTGGAIKLTHKMREHPDTQKELDKIEAAKRYLKNIYNIENEEDLIYYYETEQ